MYIISHLFIYPVKSLGGFQLSAAVLTDRGFQYDRRWMLVDSDHKFITQRECPAMSLLQTAIDQETLLIYHKHHQQDVLKLPLQPTLTTTCTVRVWDDECIAQYVSETADEWLTHKLSLPCRLVYMPDSTLRKVETSYALNDDITSFSDGYPVLMIGQPSLDDLNSRLAQPLPMDRFRPNIVFTGGSSYDEDTMEHVRINNMDLFGVKLCARCTITTIDQTNAHSSKEPLKTFARYRMKNNKVYFGQNMLHRGAGLLQVGDVISVVKTKASFHLDTSS